MSAQPPTTPRIEDLRARLRLDPKARHFYPLAEELKKLGQRDEAEKILREGLTHHPAYLSAWVSLGRVLAEKGAHQEAIEALTKALAIDPGNVVCANLLASSYLAIGERVEALKKLKLVRAVMPGDEVEEQIAALETEIASSGPRAAGFAPPAAPEAAAPPPVEALQPGAGAEAAPPPPSAADATPEVMEAVPEAAPVEPPPAAPPEPETAAPAEPRAVADEPEPPAMEPAAAEEGSAEPPVETAGWEPPAPSPFLTEPEEEAAPESAPLPPEAADVLPEEVFTAPTEVEHPYGEPVAEAREIAEAAASPQQQIEDAVPESTPPFGAAEPDEPFAAEDAAGSPAEESFAAEPEEAPAPPAAIADDQTATLTMADLYAKQGHDVAARDIYERVLERDPSNEDVRARLAALAGGSSSVERDRRLATAARLERWLEKVGRRGL